MTANYMAGVVENPSRLRFPSNHALRSSKKCALGQLAVFLLLVNHPSTCEPVANVSSRGGEKGIPAVDAPRILTVLTTYNERTPFVKAYLDSAKNRKDGYQPWIFVASDVEDEDPDGVVDFKVGEPHNHRLLEALAEAYSRFKGKFDWIAVGDDDTVFMYRRAMALLGHLNHTQPLAFGRVDGLCGRLGRPAQACSCLTPSETKDPPGEEARHCCLDFTRPCDVPTFERTVDSRFHKWYSGYEKGELFWAYGGSGFFLSAGLAHSINNMNGGENKSVEMGVYGSVNGWDHCVARFGLAPTTDVQVAMCMAYRGFSMSTYPGFIQTTHSGADHIRHQVASNCQLLAIHLGIKRVLKGEEYTSKAFGAAVSAIREEDEVWANVAGQNPADLKRSCSRAWKRLTRWQS